MKVILLEELRGRGGEGDVIDVANGFAVNYLFPRRIAVEATSGNLKQLEQRKHTIAKREGERVGGAEGLRDSLEGKKVTISMLVGEEGHLFGSVTTAMIEEALEEQHGIKIDRKKLETHGAIKTAGEHEITAAIYREIKAVFIVDVVPEGELVEEGLSSEEILEAVEEEVAAEEIAEVAEAEAEAAEAEAEALEDVADVAEAVAEGIDMALEAEAAANAAE